MSKPVITYRVVVGKSTYVGSETYGKLYIYVRMACHKDAVEDVTEAQKRGKDTDYYTKRLLRVIAETGGSVYLDDTSSYDVEFTWQSDQKDWTAWYGGSFAGRLHTTDLQLLQKILKATGDTWEATPAQIIAGLEKLKAVRVQYMSDDHVWIGDALPLPDGCVLRSETPVIQETV